MRWERLFDDLEAQLEAGGQADLEAELRDRSRAERARIRTIDRLRAAVGGTLDLSLRNGRRERGRLLRCGPDWLLLEPEPGREVVVPLAAVVLLGGLPRAAIEPGSEGLVAGRLDLRHVLRAVARDRSRVTLALDGGLVVAGIVLQVGADHLEVSEDGRAVSSQLVPFGALLSLRRLVPGG